MKGRIVNWVSGCFTEWLVAWMDGWMDGVIFG